AQEARIKLARILGQEIPYPDIGTKAQSQAYIGLDMKKLNEEKKIFLESVLPGWIKTGEEREKGYDNK
ncbi:MAG: nrfA, partial [Bacteroidetes bacterium]|nr:nrfA [Bacteroidota bacterium]